MLKICRRPLFVVVPMGDFIQWMECLSTISIEQNIEVLFSGNFSFVRYVSGSDDVDVKRPKALQLAFNGFLTGNFSTEKSRKNNTTTAQQNTIADQ